MCDTDNSNEIDFEEFKVALFACDPNSGNPIGFAPNNLLTPKDAFEMFDEDGTGSIDEDEFFFVLEVCVCECVRECVCVRTGVRACMVCLFGSPTLYTRIHTHTQPWS